MLHSETKLPGNHIRILDPVGLTNDGYGGNRVFRPNGSYGLRSYHSFTDTKCNSFPDANGGGGGGGGGLRLRVETTLEDEPDLSSPRLWKPGSPLKSVSFSHVQYHNHHYCHPMSPNSRSWAIARGRKEMMEMVRDLPESSYELSLKDIVEQKPDADAQKEINPSLSEEKKPAMEMAKANEIKQKMGSKRVKKRESKRKIVRNKSNDNERFLLKTSVFPVFFGSKKSKKNVGGSGSGSGSFRIASMPKQQSTPTGSIKGGDKDWWKRRSCISSESDDSSGLSNSGSSRSSSSSSRSSSSSGRHKNRLLPGFCFFIGRRIRSRK